MPKTTYDITEDWDIYRKFFIIDGEDWTDEHEKFLNTKWYSEKEYNNKKLKVHNILKLLSKAKEVKNKDEEERLKCWIYRLMQIEEDLMSLEKARDEILTFTSNIVGDEN